jgi:hypothetical protein
LSYNSAEDKKPKIQFEWRSNMEEIVRRPAALFSIVFALGAIILAPVAGARADGREEGPTEIEKCQTIDKSGSYKLVRNLVFASTPGMFACLVITASFVTINLAGFSIIDGPSGGPVPGISELPSQGVTLAGIAVRNGSIAGFAAGVVLGSARDSIVEGLRVTGGNSVGIEATGIVKGNTVSEVTLSRGGVAVGISATGTVTGNYVTDNNTGMSIGQGSTVIGNTATNNSVFGGVGIAVDCPSNVTDNTAVNNAGGNLVLNGNGCNNTNNVAP